MSGGGPGLKSSIMKERKTANFRSHTTRAPGPAAGFQILTASNSSLHTLEGTNTYVLGTASLIVIDPGPEDSNHITRVRAAGTTHGRVALILVTHSHSDHIGAARPLAALTGAPVRRWRAGDHPIDDGEVLGVDDVRLRALHTPGHAPDHLVFHWEDRHTLFSGDLILGTSTVMVAPPAGSMEDYLRSLERVAQLDLAWIAPGHGPMISTPAARIAEYVTHRKMRERQILDVLAGGPHTSGEIAALIYPDLTPGLRPAAEGTVLAHLLKLLGEGRVTREGNRFQIA
jgi:glyoxylase-like metal-dependent hydrolase (beta-lactamase superfamily II)